MRDECTVPTTYGRGNPVSATRRAACVPMTSAWYMWLWMTSAPTAARCAATDSTAPGSDHGRRAMAIERPARSRDRLAAAGPSRHLAPNKEPLDRLVQRAPFVL